MISGTHASANGRVLSSSAYSPMAAFSNAAVALQRSASTANTSLDSPCGAMHSTGAYSRTSCTGAQPSSRSFSVAACAAHDCDVPTRIMPRSLAASEHSNEPSNTVVVAVVVGEDVMVEVTVVVAEVVTEVVVVGVEDGVVETVLVCVDVPVLV